VPDPADEPLIYTTRGNVPLSSLRHVPGWQVNADEIVFYEEYYAGDELVRRDAHVLKLRGDAAVPQQASL
jgi:hypothetical protein